VALLCALLLSSCSLLSELPGGIIDDPDQKADAQMQHVADAVKSHDVAALGKLFSPAARNATPDLDSQLKYFLSVFPSGSAKWIEPDGGCGGSGDNDGIHSAYSWVASCDYTATVGGTKYDVHFDDVTEDTAYPKFVGIYALGIVPNAEAIGYQANGAPKPFNLWASSEGLNDFDFFKGVPNSFSGVPGVYRPGVPYSIIKVSAPAAAIEMQNIADAVKNHDVAGLEKLFSPQAREKATDIDNGLKYFLSVLPPGQMTWKLAGSLSWKMQGNIPACSFTIGGGYGAATEELCPVYKVSVKGEEFALDFVEFTVDQPDTDNVGIYALGVAPYIANSGAATAPPKQFTAWAKSYLTNKNGKVSAAPGVYIPHN
jgi:Domain of unknown function (DUF5104)